MAPPIFMTLYLLRRILQMLPTLVGVLILIFFFVRALPGDPARLYSGQEATAAEVEDVRERFGLDQPVPVQFFRYVAGLARGDLGTSFRSNRPVAEVLARTFVPTLVLSVAAIAVATLLGVVLGVAAAVRRDSVLDLGITALSILGISTPSFFLGILFIYLFAVTLGMLPVSGGMTVRGLILPTLTLAAGALGTIARFARSSMLEIFGEDYVRTARAKGVRSRGVMYKHVLRNALIPLLTIIGLQFGFLLSGAIIVETIFNFPGLGWLLIQSIDARDFPVIQALMLVFALEFVLINLLVDLLYGVVDPRIAYG